MPVDPNIPLAFQPTANIGPNVGLALQNAQQMYALQGIQKQVETQNALKTILSNPGALDATGNPTPDALGQIMAVDPATGMKLKQNALVTQDQQLRQGVMKTQAFSQKLDLLNDTYGPVMERYREALKEGKPPEQAMSLAQTDLDAANEQLSQGGLFSEQEQKTHPTKFDPIQMQRFFDGSTVVRDHIKSQTAADKESRDENRADVTADERMRHDRAMEGRGDFGNPVEVEYKGPDGKSVRVLGQQEKNTGAWVTADGDRKPLPSGVGIVKPPIPGSQAANRAAIADDLQNDPDWKDKTPGQRAAEVEQRVAIAGGRLTDPSARHSMAEEIASYQLGPLSGYALTKPGGPETMAEVLKINPDYQASRYGEVNKAMTAFSTGKQGDTLRSLNVATQHLGVIDEAADALKNGNVRVFNSIGNRIAQEFGVAAPTTFDALKQIVGTEIEKAVAGGIGAVADRDRLMKSLDGANSPQQLAAVSQDFKKLMAGQALGLKQQYEDATGFKAGPFAFNQKLMPATVKALGMASDEGGSGAAKADKLPPAKRDEGAFYQGDQAPAAHPDAKKAPDGNWYVRQGDKWAPVMRSDQPPAGQGTQQPAKAATPATPPGSHAVPAANAKDPDGTTYNRGAFVKKGDFIVPSGAAATPQASAGDDPLAQARAAIASGAPRDAVLKRLKDNGIDSAGL